MLYNPDWKEDSVFILAEQACLELANLSKELQKQEKSERKSLYIYEQNYIFSRMLWGEYSKRQNAVTYIIFPLYTYL